MSAPDHSPAGSSGSWRALFVLVGVRNEPSLKRRNEPDQLGFLRRILKAARQLLDALDGAEDVQSIHPGDRRVR